MLGTPLLCASLATPVEIKIKLAYPKKKANASNERTTLMNLLEHYKKKEKHTTKKMHSSMRPSRYVSCKKSTHDALHV